MRLFSPTISEKVGKCALIVYAQSPRIWFTGPPAYLNREVYIRMLYTNQISCIAQFLFRKYEVNWRKIFVFMHLEFTSFAQFS